jgi:hypothetical protein
LSLLKLINLAAQTCIVALIVLKNNFFILINARVFVSPIMSGIQSWVVVLVVFLIRTVLLIKHVTISNVPIRVQALVDKLHFA